MSAVMEVREPSAKYFSALQPPLVQHFELMASAPGGVAKLRELILTLAVRGKLVPQDPKDEPASELLKRIRAEKDRLIAEGKTKRGKPLAEMEDQDEPFLLPDRWCWVRLGEITNYGSPVKAGTLLPNTWVLDMEDIEKSSGRLVQRLRFAERPAVSDKNCFSKGDVLYGKLRPYLNKVLVADENGVCTTEIIPFRCFGEYEPGYFRLALSSPFFLEYVNARSYGMKMPRLGTDDARNSVFPLPPLAEQSRIVTRVEELMRLCDALEAKGQLEAVQHAQLVQTLLDALTTSTSPDELADNWQRVATHFDLLLDRPEAIDALEQTILQLAVRGLFVPQDPKDEPASELLKKIRAEKDRLIAEGKMKRDIPLVPVTKEEELYPVPHEWHWVRLRDLVSHLGDGLHGTPIYSADGEYFFVNGNNLDKGIITIKPETKRVDKSEFEKHRKPLDATSVLLSINGTLGRVAFFRNEAIILGKSACYFNVTVGLNKLFAKLLLECPDFMAYAERSATGTTIKNLGLKAIGDWPIALPPLAEQSRIVAHVESLRRLCADLRQRLSARQTTQAHLAEALITEVA